MSLAFESVALPPAVINSAKVRYTGCSSMLQTAVKAGGQVMTGGSVSLTVISWVHSAVLPQISATW